MATVGTLPNLLDITKLMDPDGKISALAELMSQSNPVLEDMPFVEGNLPTGHRSVIRTGLPTAYWRTLNQGIQPSKSTSAQIDEACGMLEAWSSVDKDLAELGGNVAAYRTSEAKAFLEAMNQEMASTVFYGNASSAPSEFNGLAVRYSSTTAASGQNIILGGGAGSDNTSIFLVGWATDKVFGIFPKGSKAGLQHDDLGLVHESNAGGTAGANMMVYKERFQWKNGIVVKDWRYCVRIPNIDISALVAKSGAADLIELMIKAIHRLPHGAQGCKPVFYMNRTVFQMLDIQRRDDVISGGGISYMDVDGKAVPHFRGFPIKVTDALVENESLVS
jgi:hypothetical protein